MKNVLLTTIIFLLHLSLEAQIKIASQVISSAGMASQNMDIMVNGTVGEVVIFSQKQDEYFVGQGFQNAFLTKVVSIKDSFRPSTKTKLYPNPAHNVVFLDSEDEIEAVSLINNAGQLISIPFHKSNKYIDISPLNEGLYYLIIHLSDQRIHHLIFVKI